MWNIARRILLMLAPGLLFGCGTDESFTASTTTATTDTTDTASSLVTGVTQITKASASIPFMFEHLKPVISADGSTIVFLSALDPFSTNEDGSKELFTISATGDGLKQLTEVPDSNFDIINYSISSDGSKIVFSSNADLRKDGSNADGNYEVFMVDKNGLNLIQITDTQSDTQLGEISADGTIVGIMSPSDLAQNGNANGQLFWWLPGTPGTFIQLTNFTDVGMLQFSMSDDASKFIFSSGDDVTGTGIYGTDIYSFDENSKIVRQLTHTSSSALFPKLSGDGTKAVFISADALVDSNDDNSFELYIAETDGSKLTRLTNSPRANGVDGYYSISNDGSVVVFCSDNDFTGENPDNYETLFMVPGSGGDPDQILVNSTNQVYACMPDLSGDGSLLIFVSNQDLAGNNAEGNVEIFSIGL